MQREFDIIVVGAGHAGCEAAAAAANMGSQVLLITMDMTKLAQMSCNPAMGGIAKGQIVREIDALGGYSGIVTDSSTIQFRMLNRSKGPAMWSPRAQCDRTLFSIEWRKLLENTPNLFFWQDQVNRLLFENEKLVGVSTVLNVIFRAKAVVLTNGTFLNGIIHIGKTHISGGRMGDAASYGISEQLRELGFEVGRMKTGTPARIDGRTVDFSKLQKQEGDNPPSRFSYLNTSVIAGEASVIAKGPFVIASEAKQSTTSSLQIKSPLSRAGHALLQAERSNLLHPDVPRETSDSGIGNQESEIQPQLPCYIAYTSKKVHDILREGFADSPLFSGTIKGIGPRYCPSIEDKLRTFADKDSHQLFLEPEGWNTHEYYIQGFSSSLPLDIQLRALRAVEGLEKVEIFRPGYAIEYDYFPPVQLKHTMETKRIENLYFAGQINGTTGYEEAAAQGLMAGINAHLKIHEKPELVLHRDQAYIGVLIDDLVTKGVDEPYRMFTSRAEYRILLRQDNADMRLTELSYQRGLASAERYEQLTEKKKIIEEILAFIKDTSIKPENINPYLEAINSAPINQSRKFIDIVVRPEFSLKDYYEAVIANGLPDIVSEAPVATNEVPVIASEASVIASEAKQSTSAFPTDAPSLRAKRSNLILLPDVPRGTSSEIIEAVEILIKYSGYINRERQLADKMNRLENVHIPSNFDFDKLSSLSFESRVKLKRHRPETIGQASRIPGVSPADISVLLVYFGR